MWVWLIHPMTGTQGKPIFLPFLLLYQNTDVGPLTYTFLPRECRMQSKLNAATPNSTFVRSNAQEFATASIAGAFMTFTAMGDETYFTDNRASNFTLSIHDIHTLHFLEPLGGPGGPTPSFDTALSMLYGDTAYDMKQSADQSVHQNAWLAPTADLLKICPDAAKGMGYNLACVSRVDSTIKDDVSFVDPRYVAVLKPPSDPTSVADVQRLMAISNNNGIASQMTQTNGQAFYNTLYQKLNFNTRYKRAYVVNPVVEWTNALMQHFQPTSTSFTVCTKIIATALITIQTGNTYQFRRLLSVQEPDWFTPRARYQIAAAIKRPNMAQRYVSAAYAQRMRALAQPQNRGRRDLLPVMYRKQQKQEQYGARHLLSATTNSALSTQTTTTSTVSVAINIPGTTGMSTLCHLVYNVPIYQCGGLHITETLPTAMAATLCGIQTAGGDAWPTTQAYLTSTVQPSISGMDTGSACPLNIALTGCATPTSGVVMAVDFLFSSTTGRITVNTNTLTSVYANQSASSVSVDVIIGGAAGVTITTTNATNSTTSTNATGGSVNLPVGPIVVITNKTQVTQGLTKLTPEQEAEMFAVWTRALTDASTSKKSAAGPRFSTTFFTLTCNLALILCFGLIFFEYSN